MVYEYLSQQGWVDFRAATDTITTFFRAGQTILAWNEPPARVVEDLMHLNAAEAALPEAVRGGRLRGPSAAGPFHLEVSEAAARFAIDSTDSGPFVGHDPRQARRLWDVTLLSSDASKLAWLAETESVEELRERFTVAVTRLAELYRGLEDPAAYERLRTFPVQATLWRAKIAVLLDEQDFAGSFREVYSSLA